MVVKLLALVKRHLNVLIQNNNTNNENPYITQVLIIIVMS